MTTSGSSSEIHGIRDPGLEVHSDLKYRANDGGEYDAGRRA